MTFDPLADPFWYVLAFVTALGLALYLTPLTIRVARNFKIHDTPDGRLKKHTEPTPYLGGLAVASAFIIAYGVLWSGGSDSKAPGILTASFMILLLGLYDDLSNLRPSVKFLGQVLAAIVLYKAGVKVNIIGMSVWMHMGLTILWVTAIANAFNIIDIMDGLASGVAFIACLFLFVIAVQVKGAEDVALMIITLAGALLGYLRFNRNPAKIFLGDTGSLFIGFLVGALSMLVDYSDPNQAAVVTPVVLLAIPIFDTAFVAFHRARKGIPFFRGSPDHFALRLRNSGLSVPTIVRRTYLVAVGLGFVSLGMVYLDESAIPWLFGVFVFGCLLAAVLLSRMPPPMPRLASDSASPPSAAGDTGA
jgi:UDP-GlcNAc:undecaprenyl-phosphate GlcNAc-1-phosphate transferase